MLFSLVAQVAALCILLWQAPAILDRWPWRIGILRLAVFVLSSSISVTTVIIIITRT